MYTRGAPSLTQITPWKLTMTIIISHQPGNTKAGSLKKKHGGHRIRLLQSHFSGSQGQ